MILFGNHHGSIICTKQCIANTHSYGNSEKWFKNVNFFSQKLHVVQQANSFS